MKDLARDEGGYRVERDHLPDDTPCRCGSCGADWRYEQLLPLEDCSLTPGHPSPAGRCGDPGCDSLAYPVDPKPQVVVLISEGLISTIYTFRAPADLEVFVVDSDVEGYVPGYDHLVDVTIGEDKFAAHQGACWPQDVAQLTAPYLPPADPDATPLACPRCDNTDQDGSDVCPDCGESMADECDEPPPDDYGLRIEPGIQFEASASFADATGSPGAWSSMIWAPTLDVACVRAREWLQGAHPDASKVDMRVVCADA